jgi:hypothetical protein
MSLLRIELFFDDEAGTWHYRVPALRINSGGPPSRQDAEQDWLSAIAFALEGSPADDDPAAEALTLDVTVAPSRLNLQSARSGGGYAGQFSCTQFLLTRLRASCPGVIDRPQRSHRLPAARVPTASSTGSGGFCPLSPAGRRVVTGSPRPPGQKWSRCAASTRAPMCAG